MLHENIDLTIVNQSLIDLRTKTETIEDKIDHIHRTQHVLLTAAADLIRHLTSGGMTGKEVSEVLLRLNTHAAKLESIAAEPVPLPVKS